jgi:hypothetical protein
MFSTEGGRLLQKDRPELFETVGVRGEVSGIRDL